MPHVRDHVQPRWPSHSRTNGQSILFCIDSSPFMPSWHLDKPPKDSAILEGPTSYVPQRGWNGKLHESCTVHEGFDSDCMECHRQEDFSETSAVHKGEFRNFLNLGVAKVCTLKQSATVACMRSESYKCIGRASAVIPVELKQSGVFSLTLACSTDSRGDGNSLKVTSARLIQP